MGEKNIDREPFKTFPEPYPPRNGRFICRYLDQESERHGMRIYIDTALCQHYKGVVPSWEGAKKHEKEYHESRSKFVCFDEFINQDKEKDYFIEIMDWFFRVDTIS